VFGSWDTGLGKAGMDADVGAALKAVLADKLNLRGIYLRTLLNC
jgi:hypothetical protein